MGDCLVSEQSLELGLTIEDDTGPILVLTLFGDLAIAVGGESATWVKDHQNRNAGQPAYNSGTNNTMLTLSNCLIDDIGGASTINVRDFINKSGGYAALVSVNAKNAFNTLKMFKAKLRWKQTEAGVVVRKDEVFGNCIISGDFTRPQSGLAAINLSIETDEPYSTFETVA